MDEPDNRIEEYQAIVFAGGAGSKLYPLPSDTMPKSLLPIANRPLISFQLDLLENSQFSGVQHVHLFTSPLGPPRAHSSVSDSQIGARFRVYNPALFIARCVS